MLATLGGLLSFSVTVLAMREADDEINRIRVDYRLRFGADIGSAAVRRDRFAFAADLGAAEAAWRAGEGGPS